MMQAATGNRRNTRRLAMARSVAALVLREMSTSYGRSPGGYIWAILEPVAAIGMLAVAFSVVMRHPPLGHSFMLFYATGLLPLMTYQELAANVGGAIRFSRPLLAYPTVTYIDAIVARAVLGLLTNLVVGVIVIGTIIFFGHDTVRVDYIKLLRMIGMVAAFGVSIGLVNCFLMSLFPIWQYIWAVLNRPMFIFSGILFLIDTMPDQAREVLLYMPMIHFVSMSRAAFYDTYEGAYVSEPYVYGVSLVLAALGMLLLHRYHRTILDEGA